VRHIQRLVVVYIFYSIDNLIALTLRSGNDFQIEIVLQIPTFRFLFYTVELGSLFNGSNVKQKNLLHQNLLDFSLFSILLGFGEEQLEIISLLLKFVKWFNHSHLVFISLPLYKEV